MSWDIDVEGPDDLNPPMATYLVEITEGSDTKTENGAEVPRRRQSDNCPMIMYKAKIVMDSNGEKTFKDYTFNIMVSNDDRGQRIMRRMVKAFCGQQKGKVSIGPDTFDGKMAWVEGGYSRGWFNCEHDTWQPKDAHKIAAAAKSASTEAKSAGNDDDEDDDGLPF